MENAGKRGTVEGVGQWPVYTQKLTPAQVAAYRARGCRETRDPWGWSVFWPPPEKPRPLPEPVSCARWACPNSFERLPGSLRRYCTPACQQRAALEQRRTLEAVQAKRAYDRARYLRLKPQWNRACTQQRRIKRFRTLLALPHGRTRRRAIRRFCALIARAQAG
jgi:hypothetical protein